jgi:BolA protein
MKPLLTDIIYKKLKSCFDPAELEVVDQSARHAGHAGNEGGAGHFDIRIQALCFEGKTSLVAHREIYACLQALFPAQIHALKIQIQRLTP